MQTADFGAFDGAFGVAIQADGKIVAVGSRPDDTHPPGAFALARFNPNGSLDTSFSADGLQTTDFGVGASGTKVAIQGGDKIVAVGRRRRRLRARPLQPQRDAGHELLRRRPADDRLLFGTGDTANDVAIQANGRIVAVGFASGGATGSDFALARYNPDGSLDPSFSGDGRRRTNIGAYRWRERGGAAGRRQDRRGRHGGAGDVRFALARYLGGGPRRRLRERHPSEGGRSGC